MRNFFFWFGVFARGFLMGAADLIPGVSGGTIAFVSGIYERLIAALRSFTAPPFWRALVRFDWRGVFAACDAGFLLALAAGIAAAVANFGRGVKASAGKSLAAFARFFRGVGRRLRRFDLEKNPRPQAVAAACRRRFRRGDFVAGRNRSRAAGRVSARGDFSGGGGGDLRDDSARDFGQLFAADYGRVSAGHRRFARARFFVFADFRGRLRRGLAGFRARFAFCFAPLARSRRRRALRRDAGRAAEVVALERSGRRRRAADFAPEHLADGRRARVGNRFLVCGRLGGGRGDGIAGGAAGASKRNGRA